MVFKLNEYNYGLTDSELLDDVKRVANSLGDQYLSGAIYEKTGKYSVSTIVKRFDSWSAVLKKLDLRSERNTTEMQRISDEMIIGDLLRVADQLEKQVVTSTEYRQLGKFSLPAVRSHFGTWSNFVAKSGLQQTGFIKKIEDIELFSEIEKMWVSLGKQPTTTDIRKGASKYALDTFTRRFGGWRNALEAFLEFINSNEPEDTEVDSHVEDNVVQLENSDKSSFERTNLTLKKRTPSLNFA